MSNLNIGDKIEFKSGNKYEIVKVFEGEFYDIKALQPEFEIMPNYYPTYLSVKLKDYKVIKSK